MEGCEDSCVQGNGLRRAGEEKERTLGEEEGVARDSGGGYGGHSLTGKRGDGEIWRLGLWLRCFGDGHGWR